MKRETCFAKTPTSIPSPQFATKEEVPFEQKSFLLRFMEAKKAKEEDRAEKIKKEAKKAGFEIV
jgi:hypothetical protein